MKKIFVKNEEHVILTIKEIMPSTPKNARQLVEKGAMDKALKPVYHLTTAEPFWDIEGVTLIDLEGKEVTKEEVKQEDANAYVYIPTPETIVRIQNETGLEHVEIHDFKTLKEIAEAIGATSLLTKTLNKQELMNAANIVSGNEVYKIISQFAKEHQMPASTAQKYFGVKIEASQTVQLILGENVQNLETKRTYKEAKELYEQIKESLGEKAACKRYAMEAINIITRNLKATQAEFIEALQQLKDEDKDEYINQRYSDKATWLGSKITDKIKDNRQAKGNAQIQKPEEQQDAA